VWLAANIKASLKYGFLAKLKGIPMNALRTELRREKRELAQAKREFSKCLRSCIPPE
jgi:hypothetical protein